MKEYLLITGATSSVGKAIIKELSSDYNLILVGRSKEKLETIRPCDDNKVIYWEQDLKQIESLEHNLAELLSRNHITVQKFVHCAGDLKMVSCKMLRPDMFMDSFAVNVFSAAMIIKALTSRRLNQKSLNSVVLISSNISNRGAKAFSIYGSSKAALDGLMRNLAVELAPNVRINSILPGGMKTKMTEKIFADSDIRTGMENYYPMGIGTPADLAPLAKLLLSEKCRWITGQQFVIDGGRTINITDR